MKIALILADTECTVNIKWASHAAVCSWESILPDFDRCPKEAPLLSQVLWVNGMHIAWICAAVHVYAHCSLQDHST